jgi:hypothetical protein
MNAHHLLQREHKEAMQPPFSIRCLKGKRQKKSLSHIPCSPLFRGIKFLGTSISCPIVAVAPVTPEAPAWSDMLFAVHHSHSVFGIKCALCVKSSPVRQQSPSRWPSPSCFPSPGIAWDQLEGILSGLYRHFRKLCNMAYGSSSSSPSR